MKFKNYKLNKNKNFDFYEENKNFKLKECNTFQFYKKTKSKKIISSQKTSKNIIKASNFINKYGERNLTKVNSKELLKQTNSFGNPIKLKFLSQSLDSYISTNKVQDSFEIKSKKKLIIQEIYISNGMFHLKNQI